MKTVSIPNEEFVPAIKQLLDEGHTTTFRVKGYSMRIFLEHCRDKVILKRCDDVKVGDVVLAEVAPKFYVLHRIIKQRGDELILKGDGNVVGIEQCRKADVIGTAIGFYRKGRTKPDMTTSLKWRMYSRIWLWLTPFRRYILAFYRRIWLKIFPVRILE